MSEPISTADYRKYPKGPNFGLIVILFVVTIFLAFICAYFVLRAGGKKIVPKVPDNHPTSQVMPFTQPSESYVSVRC